MKTMREEHSKSAAYWGEFPDWLIVLARHRDSDVLANSNFECAKKKLKSISKSYNADTGEEFENVIVESSTHWAVGWVEYLIINPNHKGLVESAEDIRERLEDYPILDENDFSEREMNEANDIWRDCYRIKERVEYIRKHRSQFEFRDFADMLGCVRGKYFSGYASELIG